MKSLFNKSSRKIISASLGRYISLILVSFLGAGMLAGLLAIAPDMESTADDYFKEKNMSDVAIQFPLGFTKEDLRQLSTKNHVDKVQPSTVFDGVGQIQQESFTFRLHQFLPTDTLNTLTVLKGRLPKNAGEAVIVAPPDGLKDIQLADEITFSKEDTEKYVKDRKFTLVGVVKSPLYPHNKQGTSSKGKGTVDFALFISDKSFLPDYSNVIYTKFDNTSHLNSFSEDYEKVVQQDIQKLQHLATQQSKKQVALTEEKLQQATTNLETQQHQLTSLKEQGKLTVSQLATSQEQLTSAKTQLQQEKDQLTAFENPQWYFETRSQNQGFGIIKGDAESMKSLAAIFPIIFFLVAALVSLTSMTRMVDEERTLMGTFKALGYSDGKIASRYLSYSLSGTLIGSSLGVIVGFLILPKMIWIAYSTQYSLPEIALNFHVSYGVMGILTMSLVTTFVTGWTVYKTLQEMTAQLLIPKAPIAGKRIFLEKIAFVWKRLSFSQKVTQRNIFLDKKRMLMTVLGVIGSTTLLVTAFGLQNSASTFPKKQYEEITKYQLVASFDATTSLSAGEKEALKAGGKAQFLPVHTEAVEVTSEKEAEKSYFINLVVPADIQKLPEFITLTEEKEKIPLAKEDVILTKNVAERLNLRVGDKFSAKLLTSQSPETLRLTAIVDNYHLNYLYLDEKSFTTDFQKDFSLNQAFLVPDKKSDVQKLVKELGENQEIKNVEKTTTTMNRLIKNMKSIRMVVVMLIALASMLTLVVLYNVTNINIEERKREIATLKVLGFTDGETNSYVFRETIGLSFLGTLLGLVVGGILFQQIIQSFGTEYYIFDGQMKLATFIYAALCSGGFTLIINLLMIPKIKKIEMLSSLKSTE